MKLLSVLAGICLLSGTATAHDFWLNPSEFVISEPGEIDLSMRIGHAADRQDWAQNPDRIVSFKHYSPEGLRDLQSSIGASKDGILPITLDNSGLHLVTLESTHAFSELPADQFNAYLEEEALTPIRDYREQMDLTETPGREIYSRRGKTIMLVGDLPETDPDYITKPVGMTLEIVPLKNPHRLQSTEKLEAQIYYRGKPLEGAQVMLVSLDTSLGDIASDMSDETGQVSFRRPSTGDWMLHTVWSDPIEDHPMGDFDTTFSSLSFGFR